MWFLRELSKVLKHRMFNRKLFLNYSWIKNKIDI